MARTKQTARSQSTPPPTNSEQTLVVKGRSLGKDKFADSKKASTENNNSQTSEKVPPSPPSEQDFNLDTLFNQKASVPDMDKIQGNYGLQNLFRNEEVYLAAHEEDLKDRWVFWFQSPSASWGKTTKRLYTVSNFHEVQEVLGKMTAPGQLNARAEVYVFKQGIRPDRLDNRNQKGGCWAAFLPTAMPDSKPLLNSWWEAVIYNIISGEIPNYKDVVGVKVAVRNVDGTPPNVTGAASKDRLEVWTKAAVNQDKQLEIGYFLKKVLQYNGNLRLTYMKHQDVVEKTVKPAATVNRRRTGARFYGRTNNRSKPQQKAPQRVQSIKQRALYRL